MKEFYYSNKRNPESRIVILCERQWMVWAVLTLLLLSPCRLINALEHAGPTEMKAPVSIVKDDGWSVGVSIQFAPNTYELLKSQRRVRLNDFPLDVNTNIDLELERFEVTTPATVIVEGTAEGDKPIPHPEIALFKGHVVDMNDSHVVLSVSPHMNSGLIRIGELQYSVSARGSREESARGAKCMIYERGDPFIDKKPISFTCDTESSGDRMLPLVEPEEVIESFDWRVALVAVETDYEYWQLFGNSDQAVAYVIQLMGTISSFYERDIQVKWHLPFIRIWTTDACPFDSNLTTVGLEELSTYWKANMSHVNRDIVHMLSGKLDKKGRSLGALCDLDLGYSVSMGIQGWFPQPPMDNNPDNWDLYVVAHETGHNFGSDHTHCYEPPIDHCGKETDEGCWNGLYQCSDGTFMSYCWGCPGGLTNQLLYFHPRVINHIRMHVDMSCLRYGINPVYVDWTNIGFEDGTMGHPFNTVAEAVHVVIPDGTVYINPGSYPETETLTVNPSGLIINRPVTLRTTGGMVTIGG
ncbi:MAG: M12 family metallo-peptidase [Planctomycetota bacterium]|jgi:hypothetical protein